MRTDLELLHASLSLFSEKGFYETSMRDIAKRAGVSPRLAYKYHPSKDALAMALYARIADRFEAAAPDLPSGTIADRFIAAMERKLSLITPHRGAMRALTARALDPTDRLGILGPRTGAVRSRNSGVFHLVVAGASDAPEAAAEQDQLGRLLYGAHLALILVWTQDTEDANPRTHGALSLLAGGLQQLPLLLAVGGEALSRADGIFGDALSTTRGADDDKTIEAILEVIFQRRRLHEGSAWPAPPAALALHRPAVARAVAASEPLQLVLPAFPAKSPNPKKTLGPAPDLAEVLALRSLQTLCDDVAAIYPPGASLIIASDGHVFADLVEVPDADVDAYQASIRNIIAEEDLHRLSVFDLRDVMGDVRGDEARALLVERYAMPLDVLRARAKEHPRHQAQYNGIHRFLFEDAVVLHPDRSRSANRKGRVEPAWQVVQRSEAWGALVAQALPDAIRLSIHPQPQVSEKIGIHLIETDDAWLTPWHAAAVVSDSGARLMKREDAEALGATVAGDHLVLP